MDMSLQCLRRLRLQYRPARLMCTRVGTVNPTALPHCHLETPRNTVMAHSNQSAFDLVTLRIGIIEELALIKPYLRQLLGVAAPVLFGLLQVPARLCVQLLPQQDDAQLEQVLRAQQAVRYSAMHVRSTSHAARGLLLSPWTSMPRPATDASNGNRLRRHWVGTSLSSEPLRTRSPSTLAASSRSLLIRTYGPECRRRFRSSPPLGIIFDV
jgi:hypothetical protein